MISAAQRLGPRLAGADREHARLVTGHDLPRELKSSAAVLDGELACLGGDGRSEFNPLLFRRAAPCFVAFDLLWLEGKELRDRPRL